MRQTSRERLSETLQGASAMQGFGWIMMTTLMVAAADACILIFAYRVIKAA